MVVMGSRKLLHAIWFREAAILDASRTGTTALLAAITFPAQKIPARTEYEGFTGTASGPFFSLSRLQGLKDDPVKGEFARQTKVTVSANSK